MSLAYLKVTAPEVDPLHAIVRDCGEDMARQLGLNHWSPPYPIETMRENAVERNVHAVFQQSALVGTFTTGTHGWKYDSQYWMNPAARALYLGKLAVRPPMQGAGIGTWCLKQVETQARELGCSAVRFDAITAHSRLVSFYLRSGYLSRGQITVTDALSRDWNVTLFEKVLE